MLIASPWAMAAAATARSPVSEVEIRRDLAYGPHARHRLDAYLQLGGGPHPVIVFVHGGGHVSGDKRGGGLDLILPAARAGYSILSINYRLAPEFRHPAQVEDARLAVRWIRAHAAELRVDAARLAVAGASAGGHIVTFLAFTSCPGDPAAADPVARQSCRPRTAVNFFGTTDLRARNDTLLVALLGPDPAPGRKADASPILHVSPDDPPTLSLHGTADPLVPYSQSVALHGALAVARVLNRLVPVASGGHGSNWFALPGTEAWQRELVAWLDLHVRH
jgi:acetyl esterase/lipase